MGLGTFSAVEPEERQAQGFDLTGNSPPTAEIARSLRRDRHRDSV